MSFTPENSSFTTDIISWYSGNYRHLPWRITQDPFRVWLSEIILQQTRVSQGLPYYEKFVERFANVETLAEAKETDVLKLWQGLGYYSRARNMHACAKSVVSDYGGNFPDKYDELLKLKGVGKYTAAAIASICFDEVVPTVDGNVYRVFSRVFDIKDDIAQSRTFKIFFELGSKIISAHQPGQFNQAVMELGALICKPKKPKCYQCPVSLHCYAFAAKTQHEYPVKIKKLKIKHRTFHYLVFVTDEQILIRSRPPGGIWAGLSEFYLIELEKGEHLTKKLDKLGFDTTAFLSSEVFTHLLTHQKLKIQFHVCKVPQLEMLRLEKNLGMQLIDLQEINSFAVPKPIERFLKKNYLSLN